MPKKQPSSEVKIEELRQRIERGGRDSALAALQNALKEKSNFVVAKAARWAGEHLYYDLIPDLVQSYERFLRRPLESDKTCAAKKAIVKALYELDYDNAKFYRTGLGYRQLEPVWGAHVDTAVEVRCSSAFGLAASNDPRVMTNLIELLHDKEYAARAGAVKAMELLVPYQTELVLRCKILQGDDEPAVIAQCFSSLMKVAAEDALDFVARHLQHDNSSLREGAALALGECRLDEALDILIAVCNELVVPTRSNHKPLFQAIAMQRKEQAINYLLQVVEGENTSLAGTAIEALSIYSYNETLKKDIEQIIARKQSAQLRQAFAEFWRK
jgi:HEAT repeat protein